MMRRSDSIADMMPEALRQSRYHMKRCFQRYVSQGSRLMKQQHLLEEFHGGGGSAAVDNKDSSRLADSFLGRVISCTHEAVVLPPYVALAVRRNPGVWEYITVHSGDLTVQQITPSDYLKCKEILYDKHWAQDDNSLEVNLGALDLSTPRLTLPSSIGNGMHLVSRFLSSRLGGGGRPGTGTEKEKMPSIKKPLLDYLLALRYRPGDQQNKLLIGDTLDTVGKLQAALLLAQAFVSEQHPDTPYQQMAHRFQEWGLEKGWGDTAEACGHTLACLSEVLQAPDPSQSPCQSKPLLMQLTRLIPEAKGTTCNVELEPIDNTRHSSILRVPFKTQDGQDLPHWVSRFDIYPYLVSRKLGVTQGTIAHALEKTKYEDSDVKWREMDHKYHFSCQFTADMIAMNTSDFIIASTWTSAASLSSLGCCLK